jgi:DHA2 family multidrug resistance protein-like MFS transporter
MLLRLQRGHPAPMLAIDLLRIRRLRLSSLTSICAFSTQSAAMVALPFFLQGTLGVSVVRTGFFIAAWPLVVGTMAVLIAPLTDGGRYSAGLLCSVGLAILTAGLCALALTPANASGTSIFIRLAVCGFGFGFFQAPNLREIMSNAPPHRSGGASGLVAISRLMGQTIGAAIVAQCFHWSSQGAPVMALWIGGGIALLGCAVSAMRLRRSTTWPAARV